MSPPPSGRPSWPSRDDNAGFCLAIILLGGAALAVMVWFNYHGAISAAVMLIAESKSGPASPSPSLRRIATTPKHVAEMKG